jgi:hypothetical protein
LSSAQESRIIRLRRPTAYAVRVSALAEALTSTGALNVKAAGGIEPPMNPCQESALATWLRRQSKNKSQQPQAVMPKSLAFGFPT